MTSPEQAGTAVVNGERYDPFSYSVQEDPYPYYAWMRENAPTYYNDERDFYALTRHADVHAALRDAKTFTNRNGISIERSLWGPQAYKNVFFLALDPPDHTRLRGLVQRQFTPRSVAHHEDTIREFTLRRLRPLLDGDTFDFARDFAAAVPNDMVCHLLGIPADDYDLIRFDTDLLTSREPGTDDRSQETLAAAFRLATYYVEHVAHKRKYGGADLTAHLVEQQVDGEPLTDSEIVAFLFLLVSGGNESTGKLLGNAWYHGWRLPEVSRRGLAGESDAWINETLRYDSSSQMTSRTSTKDVVVNDVTIPEGSRVVLLHASGNRDCRVFDQPDVFDMDRDSRKALSFGAGPHHCLGSALATVELRVMLDEVARHIASYEIDETSSARVHSAHQRGFAHLTTRILSRR